LKVYFEEQMKKIDQGEPVRIWDGKSTKLFPQHRVILDRAYNSFLELAGYKAPEFTELEGGITDVEPEIFQIEDLEQRFLKLLKESGCGECSASKPPTPCTQGPNIRRPSPIVRTKEERKILHPEVNAEDLQQKLDSLFPGPVAPHIQSCPPRYTAWV
jgi:hypothetical protein